MHIYLTQTTAQNISSPTSNPSYLVFTAIIAGAVAITVAYITNLRADKREIEKTRREILSSAVTSLIEKSETVNSLVATNGRYNGTYDMDNELTNSLLKLRHEMKFELIRIQIHGSDHLYEIANKLYRMHLDFEGEIEKVDLGELKYIMTGLDFNSLAQTTIDLIDAIRLETKMSTTRRFYRQTKQSPDEDATNRP